MLEMQGRKFFMDGKEFHIYSGAMHYFRIPCEYWEDRLKKLKAAGLNTVETYVAWNMHQPTEDGGFNFEGQNDLFEYIRLAQKVGLYVIVRPGPYICAEWELGGFPSWLLKYNDIQLRCYSEPYITFVKNYFDVLIPKLAELQLSKGGKLLQCRLKTSTAPTAGIRSILILSVSFTVTTALIVYSLHQTARVNITFPAAVLTMSGRL